MGPDLTGPNFNQSDVNTVEVLAKRAKHSMFGADEADTKSITEDLKKDEDQEADEKEASEAMNKEERDAKNNITVS